MSTDLSQLFGLAFPFIIIFVVFYLLIWRPQSIEQKKRKEMLDNLKKGDKVVTVGGIRGVITLVKKEFIVVKIADKVEIEMDRSGIASVRD
ncbi:MAG TPA: preprotein translocase subunit YajC [Clostridiales bacterium]|nr:preprotein translocase subunit YajC [Clostridiales bacterium]